MVMVVESYLKETIDSHVVIKPWREKDKLPLFLKNSYEFYEMVILGHRCVMLEILYKPQGFVAMQKHIRRIQELTDQEIVLHFKEITRYRRKSLIVNRVPFIIEDGQVFLPFLGMDLKSDLKDNESSISSLDTHRVFRQIRYLHEKEEETTVFSATTQRAYLSFLYNQDLEVNTTEFAEIIGVTKMTASRALNDLYHAKLITYEVGGKTGRSKVYRRIQDPYYFEKGMDFLKTPVREVIYVRSMPDGALVAGLDALAQLSMINPPDHAVRALSRQLLEKVELEIVTNRDMIKDEKLIELQIWAYDPRPFTHNKYVDLLSLHASLKEEHDERVEQALKEVLGGEKWYTG